MIVRYESGELWPIGGGELAEGIVIDLFGPTVIDRIDAFLRKEGRWRFSEERRIVRYLRRQERNAVAVVHISSMPADWRQRFGYHVIPIIQAHGATSAYCPQCAQSYLGAQVICETWSYYHGPLASGGGWEAYCPQRHRLYMVQEWIS
jgi:hypothetical protein